MEYPAGHGMLFHYRLPKRELRFHTSASLRRGDIYVCNRAVLSPGYNGWKSTHWTYYNNKNEKNLERKTTINTNQETTHELTYYNDKKKKKKKKIPKEKQQ